MASGVGRADARVKMTRFQDIFDQSPAVEWLRRTLAAGRLPHAMVFAGPIGVGKGTTAAALAGAFLCESPTDDADACGACASCRAMSADTHPDYHRVYRQLIRLKKPDVVARDLSVDVIRDYLIEPAGLKSATGRGKVFVVDEAELMNFTAQNALLKTLEEPPGRTLIVLLAEQPSLLLSTIRSRTQILRFAPLPAARIASELKRRQVGGPGDADDAARFARGSLGLALRWIQDGVIAAGRELISRLQRLPDGAVELAEWMQKAAADYAVAQQARDPRTSKDAASREGMMILLNLAAERFREKLAAGDVVTADAVAALCGCIEAAVQAERYVDANVTLLLAAEYAAGQWTEGLAAAR